MERGWAKRLAMASVPLVVVALVLGVRRTPPALRWVTASLGGREYNVTVADDDAARRRGLQGYAALGRGEGMLFAFEKAQPVTMDIKALRYPIDVVFVDERLRVVRTVSLQPEPYGIQLAPSGVAVRYVLELPAGSVVADGVAVGTRFKLGR